MSDADKTFGKEFFDTGKGSPGAYKIYRAEDLYPEFRILATWVKSTYNPERVLDTGCAKGFLVEAFKELDVEAFGVDVSKYAISCARPHIRSNLHEVDLNKEALPFEDDYFTFVTWLGTIEYLSNHKHALHEIRRVLRQGGGLFLTTLYREVKGDKFRINIHDRDYWVKEFQSEGLRFMPEKLDDYLQTFNKYRRERLSQKQVSTSQNETLALKLGKLLYRRGGYIGREFVLLMSRFYSSYGILLFEREE